MIKNILAPGLMLGAGLFGQASDLDAQETDTKSRTELAELHDDPRKEELENILKALEGKEVSISIQKALDEYIEVHYSDDENLRQEKLQAAIKIIKEDKSGIDYSLLLVALAGISLISGASFVMGRSGHVQIDDPRISFKNLDSSDEGHRVRSSPIL